MTAPPFLLTHEQASRLQSYLQTYRRYVLSQMPSVTRNGLLRDLQSIQGKLVALLDQGHTPARLVLAREEQQTVHTSVTELLVLIARQPASAERDATLVDLTALRASLVHTHQTSSLRPEMVEMQEQVERRRT